VAADVGVRRGGEPSRAGAAGGSIAGLGNESARKKPGIAERGRDCSSSPHKRAKLVFMLCAFEDVGRVGGCGSSSSSRIC